MKNFLALITLSLIFLGSCSTSSVEPKDLIIGSWKGDLNCNQVGCRNNGQNWSFQISDIVNDSLIINNFVHDIGELCDTCSPPDRSPEFREWVTSKVSEDSVTIAYNTKENESYRNLVFKGKHTDKGKLEGEIVVYWGGVFWDGVSSDPIVYERRDYSFLYSDDVTFAKQ
jgi:hypothetical protein